MHLRKTTTSPNRGLDIMYPLYQHLGKFFSKDRSINVLLVGAGVATKMFAKRSSSSTFFRRLESIMRTLPLPVDYYTSYEPYEIYQRLSALNLMPKLRVGDVNPYVLNIASQQMKDEHMAFELVDISNIPARFVDAQYDVCVAMNVLYHVKDRFKKQQAVNNLVTLTKPDGFIVGMFEDDAAKYSIEDGFCVTEISQLIHQKQHQKIT